MIITTAHYLVLAAVLFSLSVAGIFLNRRNVILLLMCIELMLLAVNFNFVAFSRMLGDPTGQIHAAQHADWRKTQHRNRKAAYDAQSHHRCIEPTGRAGGVHRYTRLLAPDRPGNASPDGEKPEADA
jgi:hypothetical protein